MSYPEVEQRRRLLQALHQRLKASQQIDVLLWDSELATMGDEAGLPLTTTKRRFKQLVAEGYIRAQFLGADQNPFLAVTVEDLTDKGLREINVLPPENAYEALVAGFEQRIAELETNPDIAPAEKQREVSRWRQVLSALGEIGAPVVGEVVRSGQAWPRPVTSSAAAGGRA